MTITMTKESNPQIIITQLFDYKRICLIGLGSLGSFLYRHLSYNEKIETIMLIDPQIVEKSNVENSFFNMDDIGISKVECLMNKVDPLAKRTQIFQHKYIEGKTILPPSDLVIDCRDYICSRKNEIDVKFYIDERSLIIDCRKFVKRNSYNGKYIMHLTKDEIRQAAFIAYKLISSPNILNKMLENRVYQSLNIDETISNIFQDINLKQSNDLVYEDHIGLNQLHSFEDYIIPTFDEVKLRNVDVFIGECQSWKLFSNEHTTIPKGSTVQETLNILGGLILKQKNNTDYSMSLSYVQQKMNVLLLRETGGA